MARPLGYSIEATRHQLGDCSRAHVYRLVNQGKLTLVKVGGRSIITTESIEGLLTKEAA
jgi:hypothetical protein